MFTTYQLFLYYCIVTIPQIHMTKSKASTYIRQTVQLCVKMNLWENFEFSKRFIWEILECRSYYMRIFTMINQWRMPNINLFLSYRCSLKIIWSTFYLKICQLKRTRVIGACVSCMCLYIILYFNEKAGDVITVWRMGSGEKMKILLLHSSDICDVTHFVTEMEYRHE